MDKETDRRMHPLEFLLYCVLLGLAALWVIEQF